MRDRSRPARVEHQDICTTQRIAVGLLVALASFTVVFAENPESGDRITPELARRLVDEITPDVERVRGLAFEKPVPARTIDDDGARRHIIERLDRMLPPDKIEATETAYQLLGLLPKNLGILEVYLDALREQAGGFYDPEQEAYYLLDDMPASLAEAITAHELTHALEDQHFDLDSRLTEVLEDDDRAFAVGAVHEGSAMLVMSIVIAQRLMHGDLTLDDLQQLATDEQKKMKALDDMPPVLLRQLVGTYILGANFLARGNFLALMNSGFPVSDVDRAFTSGPVSSEQILHPEKYWDAEKRDEPVEVRLPDLAEVLGSGWTARLEGVLGELTLGVITGAGTPMQGDPMAGVNANAWTDQASSGWGGDRWAIWRSNGRQFVLLVTEWDSVNDAEEFAEALDAVGSLRWKRQGTRVAIVGGKLGKKKTRRVLAHALD